MSYLPTNTSNTTGTLDNSTYGSLSHPTTTPNWNNYVTDSITISSPFFNPYQTFSTDYTSNELKNKNYKIYFGLENCLEFSKRADELKLLFFIETILFSKMFFKCAFDEKNRIQPYEFISILIETKKTFTVKIEVSDILYVNYINFKFTKIINNLKFSNNTCDFSELIVKFKYEKIISENLKLNEKQKRGDKLKKILNNEN